MEKDKRYQGSLDIPESLLEESTMVDEKFSIRGQFRDGRAAYLDLSATTPMDPRVLDTMAPFMVSMCCKRVMEESHVRPSFIDVVPTHESSYKCPFFFYHILGYGRFLLIFSNYI